jgi:peptidoglycan/LPS O-acetylase OafA/YrhL
VRPVELAEVPVVPTSLESVSTQSSQTCPARKAPRFPELDGLRGLAAVGVLGIHYMVGAAHKLPLLARTLDLLEMSPLSLDIFFILSGFLIGGILLRTRNAPHYYKTFYQRRFSRILPLYYAWIALFSVLYFVGQGWGLLPPQGYSGAFYLASFACFFQNFFPAIIRSTYIVAPTWTLVVEEYFYLLIPLCVRRLSSRRLAQLLIAVIVLAPLFRGVLFKYIGHRSDWADIATRIWPPCRADALAMGVLLAMAWSVPEIRAWLQNHLPLFRGGMFACSGLAILFAWMAEANLHYSRFLNVSLGRSAVELACLCLIVFLICRPQAGFGRFLSSNIMREFGKISYCLYIVHWGVYWMIFRFVLHARFGERLWLDFVVAPIAFLISCAIAELSWKYFELPILLRARGVPGQLLLPAIPDRQSQTA